MKNSARSSQVNNYLVLARAGAPEAINFLLRWLKNRSSLRARVRRIALKGDGVVESGIVTNLIGQAFMKNTANVLTAKDSGELLQFIGCRLKRLEVDLFRTKNKFIQISDVLAERVPDKTPHDPDRRLKSEELRNVLEQLKVESPDLHSAIWGLYFADKSLASWH